MVFVVGAWCKMKSMKRLGVVICSSLCGLGLLFFATNPHQVPALLLAVPFALVSILLFSVIKLTLYFFALPNNKERRIALLGALTPTLLMGLRSAGQLTVRDFLTIALLVGLSYFYITRLTRPRAA